MVPEICQNIPITVVPNFLIKIAATLPKSPISEPPVCILALTNYKTCIGLFPKLSPTYHFRNPKFLVAEKKWKAIHLLWRQAGSTIYLWQTCLNVGYRLLSTNLLSHPGNQTNTSSKNTNIPANLDCTKGQAFQLLHSLRATMCTDKDYGSMPTGSHECKESLSCGKITKLKQAQKSFLFNAWIKHPRHRGHYCRWLWFPTAQHTSSRQPSLSKSSLLSVIRSINTSFLERLEATQGTARQSKLCHKDTVRSTEC